ncbi:related to GIP2 Glc7p-interacting protein [Rhynchosporium secalis]|uniref:Related to GIP2 Glc7p-interacting protein n=1 Tax=Rhynchosporium secalis TaxID=38038 RepID=A0A1E1MHT1_RHYSE|nr:related to GIP2 Glc7p-interacting protein [Rhynchosporium secalis]
MPYTPPSQRSPAASAPHSPTLSRRSSSSYQDGQMFRAPTTGRPELPRSTSYLTRHRRTTSVKTASFEPSLEPTPPGTADKENNDTSSLTAISSIRQSPPPVTDEAQIPAGAVISPPDSAQNSSDDEDTKESRGRDLAELADLKEAIRFIEQHRESSPNRKAEEVGRINQALTLIMPSETLTEEPTTSHVGEAAVNTIRKIGHNRSNTESVFIDLRKRQPDTPQSGSDEESFTDDEELDRPRRNKPPMLRKKSGELVRPALRPSSARRRPSSMPGTPTFSKAVHFDSHLEHVRHFLQVDRPLAVSAGSSPVESSYDSDTEFPFNDESRSPPFEWEISVSNFPDDSPLRIALPVRVERVFLSSDNKTLVGSVAVANWGFQKNVVARFTLDYWKTTSEVVAEYNHDIRQPKRDGYDRFNFNIKLADQANLEAKTMFFCVKYTVNGEEYWDNNNSTNFQIDFRKKAKLQNGKKGMTGAASRPANSLPRSNKKSPPTSGRPRSMPVAFDDFADGFDAKYQFDDFKQPVKDYLGESGTSVRLKGVKSAVSLGSDNLTRRAPQPNGQAFGNRYDFGASLSAAIQAANTVLGDKSGLTMKAPVKKQAPKKASEDAPLTMAGRRTAPKLAPATRAAPTQASSSGTESPRPAGTEQPALASQSYNELLDKYCFFGSVKSSPQLKDGILKSDQYDGSNDDGYVLASVDSTADSSPLMMQTIPTLQDQKKASTQASRSASPAPMTGFVSGTSPMYHNLHAGFSFHDAHTPTAIRG